MKVSDEAMVSGPVEGPGDAGLRARLEAAEQALAKLRAEVADERALYRRTAENEKMAAVGLLAGGVAHEINNPLGGILAFTQLMKRDAGRSESDLESLQLIEESALRCKRIIDSLLRFSRGSSRPQDRRPFDLNRCIEDACLLFKAHLRSAPRARLELELDPHALTPVHGDPVHLAQVVLALLHNAHQALPEGRGTLRVRTVEEGDAVRISVSDDGVGISPEDLPRIFEPSFTTRPPGEGIGMGLSIAYRIVKDHAGHFSVESRPGEGSTFTIQLPLQKG